MGPSNETFFSFDSQCDCQSLSHIIDDLTFKSIKTDLEKNLNPFKFNFDIFLILFWQTHTFFLTQHKTLSVCDVSFKLKTMIIIITPITHLDLAVHRFLAEFPQSFARPRLAATSPKWSIFPSQDLWCYTRGSWQHAANSSQR